MENAFVGVLNLANRLTAVLRFSPLNNVRCAILYCDLFAFLFLDVFNEVKKIQFFNFKMDFGLVSAIDR